MGYLAIDFGGTRLRAAWFDDDLQLQQREEALTHADRPLDDVIGRIVALGRQVIPPGERPHTVGVAAPSPQDSAAGVILHAATLPGWRNVPLGQLISDALDAPTVINNDANLSALAEARIGAARGCNPVVYLTLSTGIGGGLVIDNTLFTGWRGMAIEPGHMCFVTPSGDVRRLEQLASGTALGQIAANRLTSDSSIVSTLRECDTVTGQAVGETAAAGDAFALDMVNEAARWLGLGIVNLLHLYNPQAVVLGGSVTKLGDLLLRPLKETVVEQVMSPQFNDADLIRLAALGDNVCLHGAAQLAYSYHQNNL